MFLNKNRFFIISLLQIFSFCGLAQQKGDIWLVAGDVVLQDSDDQPRIRLFEYNKDSSKLNQRIIFSSGKYKPMNIQVHQKFKTMVALLMDSSGAFILRHLNTANPYEIKDIDFASNYYYPPAASPVLVSKNNKILYQQKICDRGNVFDFANPLYCKLAANLTDNKKINPEYNNYLLANIEGDAGCTYEWSQFFNCTPNYVTRNRKPLKGKGNIKILMDDTYYIDSTKRIIFDIPFPDTLEICWRPVLYIYSNEVKMLALDTIPYTEDRRRKTTYKNVPRKCWVVNTKYKTEFMVKITGSFPRVKLFGKYISGNEIWADTEKSPSIGHKSRSYVRSNEYLFNRICCDHYYPGILFVIDTETKHQWKWETGQGDSEILYISNKNEIYYRVLHRIYKRKFSKKGLAEAELLVEDIKNVPLIHWMWIN